LSQFNIINNQNMSIKELSSPGLAHTSIHAWHTPGGHLTHTGDVSFINNFDGMKSSRG
jgi:hypothetical protein